MTSPQNQTNERPKSGRTSGVRTRASNTKDMSPSFRPIPSPPTSDSPDNAVMDRSGRRSTKRRKVAREGYIESQDLAASMPLTAASVPGSTTQEDGGVVNGGSPSSDSTPSIQSTIKVNGTDDMAPAVPVLPDINASSAKFHVALHDYPMNHDPAGMALWVLHKIQSVREGVSETSKLKVGPRRSSQSLKRIAEVAAKLARLPLFRESFSQSIARHSESQQTGSPKVAEAASKLVDVLPAVCDLHPSQRSQSASDDLFDALNDSYYSTTFVEAFKVVVSHPDVWEGMDTLVEHLRPTSGSSKVLEVPSHSSPKTDSPSPNENKAKLPLLFTRKSRNQDKSHRDNEHDGDTGVSKMSEDVTAQAGEVTTEPRSSRRERKPTAKALAAGIHTLANPLSNTSPASDHSPLKKDKSDRISGHYRLNLQRSTTEILRQAAREKKVLASASSTLDTPLGMQGGSSNVVNQPEHESSRPRTSPPRLRIRPLPEESEATTTPVPPSNRNPPNLTLLPTQTINTADTPLLAPGFSSPPQISSSSESSSRGLSQDQMLDNLFACVAEIENNLFNSESDEDEFGSALETSRIVGEAGTIKYEGVHARQTLETMTHNDKGVDQLANRMLTDLVEPAHRDVSVGGKSQSASISRTTSDTIHDMPIPAGTPADRLHSLRQLTREPSSSQPSIDFTVAQSSRDHVPRPYTDKDEWTMTGNYNAWGEELVELDRSLWVTVQHKSTASYPKDIPPPRRRYKTQIQIDDDRVFGFPPEAGKNNLPKDREHPKRVQIFENVDLEQQKVRARKVATKRGIKVDRRMSLQKLEEAISGQDGMKYTPAVETKEKTKYGSFKIPGANTTVIDFNKEIAEKKAEEAKRLRYFNSPDLNFQHLAKKAPLLTEYAPMSASTSRIDFRANERLDRAARPPQTDAPDLDFTHLAKKGPFVSPHQSLGGPNGGNLPILSPFGKLVATPASAPRDTKRSQYHQLKDAQVVAKKRSASDGGLNASDAALAGLNGAVTNGVFGLQPLRVKRPRGPDPNFKVISTINLQRGTSSRQLPDFKRGGKIMKFN